MRKKETILADLKGAGVVAVARVDDASALIEVARALAKGGIRNFEITMTVPKALQVIEKATDALGDEVVFGAGTVLDAETARSAILAGAGFVVSPALRPAMIEMCRRYGVAAMAGAMTPNEVLNAWEAGSDIVKIFPAGIGGPGFIKELKGPFPFIDVLVTGMVDRVTAPQYIKAGVCAVGLGSALMGKELIEARQFDTITRNAEEFIEIVKKARGK